VSLSSTQGLHVEKGNHKGEITSMIYFPKGRGRSIETETKVLKICLNRWRLQGERRNGRAPLKVEVDKNLLEVDSSISGTRRKQQMVNHNYIVRDMKKKYCSTKVVQLWRPYVSCFGGEQRLL